MRLLRTTAAARFAIRCPPPPPAPPSADCNRPDRGVGGRGGPELHRRPIWSPVRPSSDGRSTGGLARRATTTPRAARAQALGGATEHRDGLPRAAHTSIGRIIRGAPATLNSTGPMAPPLPLYPLPIDPSLWLHRCWCLECVPLRRRVVHALGDTGRRREASGGVAGEREECAECTRR